MVTERKASSDGFPCGTAARGLLPDWIMCNWSLWVLENTSHVYGELGGTIFLSCPDKTALFHEREYTIILVLLG
jgi:hypothetical protein